MKAIRDNSQQIEEIEPVFARIVMFSREMLFTVITAQLPPSHAQSPRITPGWSMRLFKIVLHHTQSETGRQHEHLGVRALVA